MHSLDGLRLYLYIESNTLLCYANNIFCLFSVWVIDALVCYVKPATNKGIANKPHGLALRVPGHGPKVDGATNLGKAGWVSAWFGRLPATLICANLSSTEEK